MVICLGHFSHKKLPSFKVNELVQQTVKYPKPLTIQYLRPVTAGENQIATGRAAVSNITNETARPTYIFFISELKLVC